MLAARPLTMMYAIGVDDEEEYIVRKQQQLLLVVCIELLCCRRRVSCRRGRGTNCM